MEKIYKISFDLNEKDFTMLEGLAKEKNISIADVIRKSLSYYNFIDKAVRNNEKILIVDKDENMNQVHFI